MARVAYPVYVVHVGPAIANEGIEAGQAAR